jgi:uncharacterized protein (TIGR02246 family)
MNKKILLQFSVCIFAGMTLLSGCSPKEKADLEADVAAISDIWSLYASSANAGDIDRWISLWTEDGVQMPPNEPPIIGKDQILIANKAAFDQFTYEMEITNEETRVAGDLAFSRGIYTATLSPKNGNQPALVDGKFMTILERQPNGSWKIHRDIFNSNVPLGGE